MVHPISLAILTLALSAAAFAQQRPPFAREKLAEIKGTIDARLGELWKWLERDALSRDASAGRS